MYVEMIVCKQRVGASLKYYAYFSRGLAECRSLLVISILIIKHARNIANFYSVQVIKGE